MYSTGGLLLKYTPAKTVTDCFKYRNEIGRDMVLEALKDCRQSRRYDGKWWDRVWKNWMSENMLHFPDK